MTDQEIGKDILNRLKEEWKISKFKKQIPKILVAYSQNRWFLVIDDSKSVFRFIGKTDKKEGIYMAVRHKCIAVKSKKGDSIYKITERDALQIASTTSMIPLDDFGLTKLASIYWKIRKTPSKINIIKKEEEEEEEEESEEEEEEEESEEEDEEEESEEKEKKH